MQARSHHLTISTYKGTAVVDLLNSAVPRALEAAAASSVALTGSFHTISKGTHVAETKK